MGYRRKKTWQQLPSLTRILWPLPWKDLKLHGTSSSPCQVQWPQPGKPGFDGGSDFSPCNNRQIFHTPNFIPDSFSPEFPYNYHQLPFLFKEVTVDLNGDPFLKKIHPTQCQCLNSCHSMEVETGIDKAFKVLLVCELFHSESANEQREPTPYDIPLYCLVFRDPYSGL